MLVIVAKLTRLKILQITIDIDIFHYCSHVLHFCMQTSVLSIFDPAMDLVP